MTVPGSDPRHPYVFCADLTHSVSLFAEHEMVISSAEKEFLEVNEDKSLHHMFARPSSLPSSLKAEKLIYPKMPDWAKLSWSPVSQAFLPSERVGRSRFLNFLSRYEILMKILLYCNMSLAAR